MNTHDRLLRRRLLQQLEDPRLSRQDLAGALEAVPDLPGALVEDARRAGVEVGDAAGALARLGTGFARRSVKRFFLRPEAHLPENLAA
jgi:hypothetical protein